MNHLATLRSMLAMHVQHPPAHMNDPLMSNKYTNEVWTERKEALEWAIKIGETHEQLAEIENSRNQVQAQRPIGW